MTTVYRDPSFMGGPSNKFGNQPTTGFDFKPPQQPFTPFEPQLPPNLSPTQKPNFGIPAPIADPGYIPFGGLGNQPTFGGGLNPSQKPTFDIPGQNPYNGWSDPFGGYGNPYGGINPGGFYGGNPFGGYGNPYRGQQFGGFGGGFDPFSGFGGGAFGNPFGGGFGGTLPAFFQSMAQRAPNYGQFSGQLGQMGFGGGNGMQLNPNGMFGRQQGYNPFQQGNQIDFSAIQGNPWVVDQLRNMGFQF